MGIPVVTSLLTLCTAAAMAIYLIARRHKEPIHWMLCGYLAGQVLWTAGVLARFTVSTPEGLAVALRVIFSGILVSASFWLLSAVTYAQRREHPPRISAAAVVLSVSALFALALFTNDGHRLFVRKADFAAVEAGPAAYVGPVFWAFLVWAYGCVCVGLALYLRAARRMLRSESRRRGLLLALASAVPPLASTFYVFQLLPVRYDLTPTGLIVSMVLLWLAVFRYQLLESLPLARDAVLAHLDDGVVMASPSGRITRWNRAAERILGVGVLRPDEDLGAALARGLGPADPRDAQALERAGSAGEDRQPASIRTADGRAIELTTARVDEGRGESTGRFAILSDRTAVDRDERRARQTQRLEIIGGLAGEVVHQINDPLTFVRANLVEIERLGARVDAEGEGPDAELAEELEDLHAVALETLEGIDRIRRIVDGMRELSAVSRETFAPVDLAGVVRDAVRLARLETGEGAALRLDLASRTSVHGNADRLVQLVLNLLLNARQALAGQPDGRIDVELCSEGGEVLLLVADNGPGIPEALRHRVFDPFFTTRGPDEGTGLGLAIAFDIAREHEGVLEVLAGAKPGARFALRLPEMPRVGPPARLPTAAGAGRSPAR